MIIFVIAIGRQIGEAIAIIVGQVGALDRHFDMVGQRIADRRIDVERTAIAFEHIVVAAGAVVVSRTPGGRGADRKLRSEEHTSELQSLMRIPYSGFCLKKKTFTNAKHYSLIRYNNNTQKT